MEPPPPPPPGWTDSPTTNEEIELERPEHAFWQARQSLVRAERAEPWCSYGRFGPPGRFEPRCTSAPIPCFVLAPEVATKLLRSLLWSFVLRGGSWGVVASLQEVCSAGGQPPCTCWSCDLGRSSRCSYDLDGCWCWKCNVRDRFPERRLLVYSETDDDERAQLLELGVRIRARLDLGIWSAGAVWQKTGLSKLCRERPAWRDQLEPLCEALGCHGLWQQVWHEQAGRARVASAGHNASHDDRKARRLLAVLSEPMASGCACGACVRYNTLGKLSLQDQARLWTRQGLDSVTGAGTPAGHPSAAAFFLHKQRQLAQALSCTNTWWIRYDSRRELALQPRHDVFHGFAKTTCCLDSLCCMVDTAEPATTREEEQEGRDGTFCYWGRDKRRKLCVLLAHGEAGHEIRAECRKWQRTGAFVCTLSEYLHPIAVLTWVEKHKTVAGRTASKGRGARRVLNMLQAAQSKVGPGAGKGRGSSWPQPSRLAGTQPVAGGEVFAYDGLQVYQPALLYFSQNDSE